MKPKKGDLTIQFDCDSHNTLCHWKVDASIEYNERIATTDDLASMGLVRKHLFDGLSERFARITDICIDQSPAEPQPHVWRVGDYAMCPDGEIRRLTHAPFYCFHDLYECCILDCTPVPEPERPKLPLGWKLHDDGRLSFIGETNRFLGVPNTLDAQLAFFKSASSIYKGDVAFLLALAKWRKLVGREV